MHIKNTIKNKLRPGYIKGKEILKYMNIKFGIKFPPQNLVLDPTYKCFLNCISCKCHKISNVFNDEDNLTKNDYNKIIKEFKNLGGKYVGIYGGEPLLFKDVFNIIEIAKKNHLHTHISTNGILLNETNSRKLFEVELDQITISIDGVDSIYNSITGSKSFNKLSKSLHTFMKLNDMNGNRKINTEIHVTVFSKNSQHLNDILIFAKQLKVPKVSIQYVSRVDEQTNKKTEKKLGARFKPELNHWDIDEDILVSKNQIAELKKEISKFENTAKELGIAASIDPALDNKFNEQYLVKGIFPLNIRCLIMWDSIFIGPNGNLSLCPMLSHFPIANAKQVCLTDYWLKNEELVKARNIILREKYIPICSYCCVHARMM